MPSFASSPIVASNAGDWLDRFGVPRHRHPVTRILCLKLDHIGDMLVADFAFRVLRESFPHAHITLICGSWNERLARRLGHSDRVIGIDLLTENGDQATPSEAAAAREEGIRRIKDLNLGSFDVAIDLRVDPDTRELLNLFDAKIYAGIGDLQKFPFLDIAMPPCEENHNEGFPSVILLPDDFSEGNGFTRGPYGLKFESSRTRIEIEFAVEGARTPIECGTSQYDTRRLGVGLRSAEVTGFHGETGTVLLHSQFTQGSSDIAFLKQGWANSEEWGTWSVADTAALFLPTAANLEYERVSVKLAFRSHTNQGNPRITVVVSDPDTGAQARQDCEHPINEHVVHLISSLRTSRVWSRSRPAFLKAGTYTAYTRIFMEHAAHAASLCASVLGTHPRRTISERVLNVPNGTVGQVELAFDFSVVDASETIQIEFSSTAPESIGGLSVVSVSAQCIEAVPPKLPPDHMEHRLAQLVFNVAAQFGSHYEALKRLPEGVLTGSADHEVTAASSIRSELQVLRDKGRVLVGVGLGANKDTKRWPLSYIVELCRSVSAFNDAITIICFGGSKDHPEGELLLSALERPTRVINLCGQTPLDVLGEVLAQLDVYIGYDTGITHYAGKVGVRTFAIFGATHHPREWGPIGHNSSWITVNTPCSPCHLSRLKDCRFGHACMLHLSPESCWAVIRPYLDAVLLARPGPLAELAVSETMILDCETSGPTQSVLHDEPGNSFPERSKRKAKRRARAKQPDRSVSHA